MVKFRSVDGGRIQGVMALDCAPVRKWNGPMTWSPGPADAGVSEPMVSTPGMTSHQLAMSTSTKMLATQGKKRRPFSLPATSSQRLSRSCVTHSHRFCQKRGTMLALRTPS